MTFHEIQPLPALRPYIRNIYLYQGSDEKDFDDIVFPSGSMELIFNLGNGNWETGHEDEQYNKTPPVELWGQITRPMKVRSKGRNVMLGVKFYVHTASLFIKENVSKLNNRVWSAADILGSHVMEVHDQLLHAATFDQQIAHLQNYLIQKLTASGDDTKIALLANVVRSLSQTDEPESIHALSQKNHISIRYLNHLFAQYTGLTPKLLFKINRFQQCLNRVNNESNTKLTSIGYDYGYFDQSHFIRDFKTFTGITPTAFLEKSLPISRVIHHNEAARRS